MTYSDKLNDTRVLTECLGYAINNLIHKDCVMELLDDLLGYRFVGDIINHRSGDLHDSPGYFDNITDGRVGSYIGSSGIDEVKLSLRCDLDDVSLGDVLHQLGCINSDTLLEIKSHVEIL